MGWGRAWFAVQAAAGAVWWLLVALVPAVRTATLGSLDPVPVAVLDLPLFVGASALAAAGLRPAAVVATGWTALVALGLACWATVTREAGIGVLLMAGATGGSVLAACLVLWGRVPTAWIASGPFAFRPADATARARRHVLTTAAQIVVFWGAALVVVPLVLAALEDRWRLSLPFLAGTGVGAGAGAGMGRGGAGAVADGGVAGGIAGAAGVAGVALLVAASALGLWAAAVMSTLGAGTPLPSAMPNRFVLAGPYRLVRNPMAVAGIAQGVGVGLVLGSWIVVAYALVGGVVWHVVIRPLEEADLEARFGDEFRRYRAAVRCWVPRAVPLRRAALRR